jgi:molybdopterin-containing oxidoreductase family iron-sulfur binding subunit
VTYSAAPQASPHAANMKSLTDAMAAGEVETLIILGGNPAYDAPADLDFAGKLKNVKTSVHLSHYENETSALCTWHLPRAHYLEAWGDTRSSDGTINLAQPLIEPLFGGRSAIEVLALLLGEERTKGYDIVREAFRPRVQAAAGDSAAFEKAWRQALHLGFVEGSADPLTTPPDTGRTPAPHIEELAASWTKSSQAENELVFIPSHSVYDGRLANNGWMQELPDPITKLTWDNALLISPSMARDKAIKTGDMVRVSHGSQAIDAVALIVPGQAAGSMTIALGYGRSMPGRICKDAGFNAYPLRRSDTMGFASGVTVQPLGTSYPLAITIMHQDPGSVGERGLQERLPTIIRSATLEQYLANPRSATHPPGYEVPHRLSLWSEDNIGSGEHAWAMSIDLSSCTGCGACVIACQAENNIPVVGKDQVRRGREMHWIRVDRYFKGTDPQKPEAVVFQPLPCQHCENAPCEQVCPVAATVHDSEGLNVMVYNRCIGTRYCSNNCPYKVRRFNYFDFQKREPVRETGLVHVKPEYFTTEQSGAPPLRRLQFNPEVTVRSRGVMEKCTF